MPKFSINMYQFQKILGQQWYLKPKVMVMPSEINIFKMLSFSSYIYIVASKSSWNLLV